MLSVGAICIILLRLAVLIQYRSVTDTHTHTDTRRRHIPRASLASRGDMQGVIADVIIHTKFFVNQFRGFGVMTARNLRISIGLAGHSYSSVCTSVLHCDRITTIKVEVETRYILTLRCRAYSSNRLTVTFPDVEYCYSPCPVLISYPVEGWKLRLTELLVTG